MLCDTDRANEDGDAADLDRMGHQYVSNQISEATARSRV